jgi:hypothetical protein
LNTKICRSSYDANFRVNLFECTNLIISSVQILTNSLLNLKGMQLDLI